MKLILIIHKILPNLLIAGLFVNIYFHFTFLESKQYVIINDKGVLQLYGSGKTVTMSAAKYEEYKILLLAQHYNKAMRFCHDAKPIYLDGVGPEYEKRYYLWYLILSIALVFCFNFNHLNPNGNE